MLIIAKRAYFVIGLLALVVVMSLSKLPFSVRSVTRV